MRERILVADDHPLVREGLRRLLSQAGFEVVEAENGEEAIKIAGELGPCLVLWDLLMPPRGLWRKPRIPRRFWARSAPSFAGKPSFRPRKV